MSSVTLFGDPVSEHVELTGVISSVSFVMAFAYHWGSVNGLYVSRTYATKLQLTDGLKGEKRKDEKLK